MDRAYIEPLYLLLFLREALHIEFATSLSNRAPNGLFLGIHKSPTNPKDRPNISPR